AKGYAIALLLGTPIGFCLGLSKTFTKTFDPIIQILRPVSPLAWLPLGLVLFLGAGKQASELGALFTIAICAMWPTVLNTAVGVRAIPQDYLNVARVLKLSRTKTLFKVLIPSALPYMFTGFRLRSEEHTSELQSLAYLVCRLLLEKKNNTHFKTYLVQLQATPEPKFLALLVAG